MSTPVIQLHTLSSSPSNRLRKLACVPVVPFTPRNRMFSQAFSRFRRSISKSWIHRHARFPTVVSWAGLPKQILTTTVKSIIMDFVGTLDYWNNTLYSWQTMKHGHSQSNIEKISMKLLLNNFFFNLAPMNFPVNDKCIITQS